MSAWRPNLGNYSLPVTAALPSTQSLFDVGLNLAFNFNQVEARRWFNLTVDAEATTCAMCWWGLALSHAPYLNHPIKPTDDVAGGRSASERAQAIAVSGPAVSKKERGLIEAMVTRFPTSPSGNQSAAAERYVVALARLHADLPSDVDVTTFFAEALMLTMCAPSGYEFYLPDGSPRPRTRQAEALLLSALESRHPYAHHLHVHLTEPDKPANASTGKGAARGLPSALFLMSTFRGTEAQHLLHMPGHTFLRIGRYSDAYLQNVAAGSADQDYLRHSELPYGPAHDAAFGLYGACMAGMRGAAYNASARLRDIYTSAPDRGDGPGPEQGWALSLTTRLRFADWHGVVGFPTEQPRVWPFAVVLRSYSNGTALLRLGRNAEASAALATLNQAANATAAQYAGLTKVARLALQAALLASSAITPTELMRAAVVLEQAVDEQASWVYDEPPDFHMPMRQCLGRLLLRAGQAERARDVYEADLRQYPANGWSLWGRKKSMEALGYPQSDIDAVAAEIAAAWRTADVPLNTSCAAFDP
jgi:tetratricopeptide (TPR) repeat protein